jgi:hypothetical protein
MRNTSLIWGLHNNGFTGINQPNTYSRRLKMTKQKQMTERELTQSAELSDEELGGVSGGLIAIIAIAAGNKGPKYRIDSKHESGNVGRISMANTAEGG